MHFFAVCDGHGLYGHNISNYIKQTLPAIIEENLFEKKLNIENSLF